MSLPLIWHRRTLGAEGRPELSVMEAEAAMHLPPPPSPPDKESGGLGPPFGGWE